MYQNRATRENLVVAFVVPKELLSQCGAALRPLFTEYNLACGTCPADEHTDTGTGTLPGNSTAVRAVS